MAALSAPADLPHPTPAGSRPAQRWPVVLETAGWDDYRLLDIGYGQKLERYGSVTVVRPEAQALGRPRLSPERWENADAVFTGDVEEEGPGRWRFAAGRRLPETWPLAYGEVKFLCRFMSFRHVGVFPEQVAHWDWMSAEIRAAKAASGGRPFRLLNLFGYTGLASLLPALAGAEVTHIDASKKAIGWARENQALSGLEHLPIRWICEDAGKFVARELRRGSRYDAIVLDPPKYGRGPKGEVFDLFADLPQMLADLETLLAPDARFLVLTAYAIRASFLSIHELMMEALASRGGLIESGELVIREEPHKRASATRQGAGGRALSTSLYSRWSAP